MECGACSESEKKSPERRRPHIAFLTSPSSPKTTGFSPSNRQPLVCQVVRLSGCLVVWLSSLSGSSVETCPRGCKEQGTWIRTRPSQLPIIFEVIPKVMRAEPRWLPRRLANPPSGPPPLQSSQAGASIQPTGAKNRKLTHDSSTACFLGNCYRF